MPQVFMAWSTPIHSVEHVTGESEDWVYLHDDPVVGIPS